MKKLITRDQEIEFNKRIIYSEHLPNNTQDIKLVGGLDLENLNLNIVKYDNVNGILRIDIYDCNINKLILNTKRQFFIKNSTINDIYVQSEIRELAFINTNIPNLHGKVDLIDTIAKTDQ